MAGFKWTRHKIALLRDLHAKGLALDDIAARLGKSPGALRAKICRLGLSPLTITYVRLWDAESDARLKELKLAGLTYPEIGALIGKSQYQCQSRAQRLGITKPRRAKLYVAPKPMNKTDHRLCLKCKKSFDSEWSGNRLCRKCAAANRDVSDDAEGYSMGRP